MKRDERFHLVNELSKAVTDKTVYEHELGNDRLEYLANTNTLKVKGKNLKMTEQSKPQKKQETEEEVLAKLYAQRKAGKE